MSSFDDEEKAQDLKHIDLRLDEAPLQKSLGLSWTYRLIPLRLMCRSS